MVASVARAALKRHNSNSPGSSKINQLGSTFCKRILRFSSQIYAASCGWRWWHRLSLKRSGICQRSHACTHAPNNARPFIGDRILAFVPSPGRGYARPYPATERAAEPQWMRSASETKILQAYLCRVIQVSGVINASIYCTIKSWAIQ